jgi:hypothetical protein
MADSELDGLYQISTVSNYDGPLERKSDGTTVIENGKTERIDDNKVKWTSEFKIINSSQIKMTSVADPTDANTDFALNRPDGTPTREPVTYESLMKYARKGDKIQMSGQIQYGDEIIFITMRRISD